MQRAGQKSDKPIDLFKIKSKDKGKPEHEARLAAYGALVVMQQRRLVFHALRGGCVGVMDCCTKPARQRMAMARAQIMVAKGHVRVPRRRS